MLHDMASQTSSYEIELASASLLRLQTWQFTLSPDLWDQLSLPQALNWVRVTFDETPACQMPNNLIGVYAFVLEPNVANLGLGYLLYVGKTTQNFRARYRKYKAGSARRKTPKDIGKTDANYMAWTPSVLLCTDCGPEHRRTH